MPENGSNRKGAGTHGLDPRATYDGTKGRAGRAVQGHARGSDG